MGRIAPYPLERPDPVWMAMAGLRQSLVIDTNIVLDLLVFDDPTSKPLHAALIGAAVVWLATSGMRDELARVLQYPQLDSYLAKSGRSAQGVLDAFDRLAQIVPAADKACIVCEDADDQQFIDLALAHRAQLLSKDQALLKLAKPLSIMGVWVSAKFAISSFTMTIRADI